MSTVFIRVAECGLRVSLIAAVTLVCLAILGRRRPALRATVATVGLVSILGVTLVAAMPLPAWWNLNLAAARHQPDARPEPTEPDPLSGPAAGHVATSQGPGTGSPGPQFDVSAAARRMADTRLAATVRRSAAWPSIVLAALAGGAAIAVLRFGWCLTTALRIRRRSHLIPDLDVHNRLAEVARRIGCSVSISLRETSELNSAAAVGWPRATIVLPIQWREWSGEELDSVLAHEIAHVARRDFVTRCAALLAGAVHFYHPLVRVLSRHVVLDQELSADELAAMAAGGRKAYLQALSRLALREDDRSRSGTIAALLPVFSGFLIRRIKMLQAMEGRGLGESRRWPGWIVAGILVALSVGVSGLRGTAAPPEAEQSSTDTEGELATPAAEDGKLDPGAVFGREPIDPSAVILPGPPEQAFAQGAFVIRVADLLKRPGFEQKLRATLAPGLAADATGLDWYWKDLLGTAEAPNIALGDIEYVMGNLHLTLTPADETADISNVTVVGEGPATRRLMFGSTLVHIRLRKVVDWEQLARCLPKASRERHDGVELLKVPAIPLLGPQPIYVFPAGDRTIAISTDENVARRAIEQRSIKPAAPAWMAHWKAADGGLATVLATSPAVSMTIATSDLHNLLRDMVRPAASAAKLADQSAPASVPAPAGPDDLQEYVSMLTKSPCIAWGVDWADDSDVAAVNVHLALGQETQAPRACDVITRLVAAARHSVVNAQGEPPDARLVQFLNSLSVAVADGLPQEARGVSLAGVVRLTLEELLFGESVPSDPSARE